MIDMNLLEEAVEKWLDVNLIDELDRDDHRDNFNEMAYIYNLLAEEEQD